MTIFMLTLSCVFVGLRVLTRVWVVKGLWWDDWCIIMAVVWLCSHSHPPITDNDDS